MSVKQPKKVTFQLYQKERRDMMKKVMYILWEHLKNYRIAGGKLKHVAEVIGVSPPRVSEAYQKRYLGEDTLIRLIKHRYITKYDILRRDDLFTFLQKAVLRELLKSAS